MRTDTFEDCVDIVLYCHEMHPSSKSKELLILAKNKEVEKYRNLISEIIDLTSKLAMHSYDAKAQVICNRIEWKVKEFFEKNKL